jgi:hypothetical protein
MRFGWRTMIADSASSDQTLEIAQRLRAELGRVDALHLEQKGLAAWARSHLNPSALPLAHVPDERFGERAPSDRM